MELKLCKDCNEWFDPSQHKKKCKSCRLCLNLKRKLHYHTKEKFDSCMIERSRERAKTNMLNKNEDELKLVKEKRKKYYEENKPIILEKQKIYTLKNIDKIKRREKAWRISNAGKLKARRESNKEAHKKYMKKWREENKEHRAEYWQYYYSENKLKILTYRKEYQIRNREILKNKNKLYRTQHPSIFSERNKIWRNKNKHKRTHSQSIRIAKKLNAMPKWLTTHELQEIKNMYLVSKQMTESTDIKHNVDHIYPLQGEFSCGLHVPWNLQVITASENFSKGNRIDIKHSPCAWLPMEHHKYPQIHS